MPEGEEAAEEGAARLPVQGFLKADTKTQIQAKKTLKNLHKNN